MSIQKIIKMIILKINENKQSESNFMDFLVEEFDKIIEKFYEINEKISTE